MILENKILIGCFGIYTLATMILLLKSPSRHFPPIIQLDQSEVLETLIFETYFKGSWFAPNKNNTFLTHNQGIAYANFMKLQSINFDDQFDLRLDTSVYLVLYLYDPQFTDERFVRIIEPIDFGGYQNITLRKANEEMRIKSNLVSFQNFNEFFSFQNVSFNGKVEFAKESISGNGISLEQFKNSTSLLKISLNEEKEEGYSFEFTLVPNPENRSRKCTLYAYFMVVIALLNYIGAQNLFHSIYQDLNFTKKLSKSTILLVCLQDCFIFLYNIQLGFTYLDTWNYVSVIVWYFVLFCFVDYRLLLYVWRYQNHREFDELTEHQFRNKLYFFQMKIYLVILVYLYFMWRYFLNINLVLLNSFVLVPQILHHIQSPEPPTFNKSFLVMFTALKYLIFMYLRGCPNNILQIRYYYCLPLMGLAVIFVSWMLLYHQENYGSRGFLPKLFKGNHYEYWIEMTEFTKTNVKDQEKLKEAQDEFSCCICLTSLLNEENNNPKDESINRKLKSKVLNRILKDKGQKYLMKTPCGHAFHADCLMRWMEIKMECPNCRTHLPQII